MSCSPGKGLRGCSSELRNVGNMADAWMQNGAEYWNL